MMACSADVSISSCFASSSLFLAGMMWCSMIGHVIGLYSTNCTSLNVNIQHLASVPWQKLLETVLQRPTLCGCDVSDLIMLLCRYVRTQSPGVQFMHCWIQGSRDHLDARVMCRNDCSHMQVPWGTVPLKLIQTPGTALKLMCGVLGR